MQHPSPADLPPLSQSASEAVSSIHELQNLLQHFIERNSELYGRVRELEEAPQIQRRLSTTRQSIRSWTSSRIAFESVLSSSRIYRRALRVITFDYDSTDWSVFSGLSLSDVWNISVFHLAICAVELSNSDCYISSLTLLKKTTTREPEGKTNSIYSEALTTKKDARHLAACIKVNHWLADIEPVGSHLRPLLHLAAGEGHDNTIRVLVGLGAKLDSRNSSGDTALHETARYGHIAAVRALVQLGADPEATNNRRQTPLIAAAIAGQLRTTGVLPELGANMEHRDSSGHTPLDYTGRVKHHRVEQILKESRADQCEADETSFP